MKQRVLVWMPPDGDSRVFGLQESLAVVTHRPEFLARPPHLVLEHDPPRRELHTGGWHLSTEGLFLAVLEAGAPSRWLRLAEPWNPIPLLPEAVAPQWVWRRGKLAWMEFEHEPGVGVRWTLEPVSGWKAEEQTAPAD